ncbi:MAG: hypothetical protein ABIQ36_05035 [Rhodanobacter sp.]
MSKFTSVLIAAAAASLLSGCAVNLPFNTRASYQTVQAAKDISGKSNGPIAVRWNPTSFPDRIDVQGASGFVGGGTKTRIPTGVGLSSRILESLDAAVGVSDSAQKILTLTIKSAKTKFQYSAGIFNITPAIDRASCDIEVDFALGDKHWSQAFHAENKDPKVGGTSQTAPVEKVWDDVALQVTKSVVQHLR